jgi:hypothetical protein
MKNREEDSQKTTTRSTKEAKKSKDNALSENHNFFSSSSGRARRSDFLFYPMEKRFVHRFWIIYIHRATFLAF